MNSAVSDVPNVNRGPLVLQLFGSLIGLDFVTLCLRFYARLFVAKSPGWDDVFILLGWIVLTIGFAFACLQVQYGFGRHAVYVSGQSLIEAGKWTLANEIQIAFTLTFIKLSACIFILRIMRDVHRGIRYTIYVLATLLTLLAITSILALSLQCFPLRHFYDRSVPGTCIASQVPQRIFQVYSVIGTIIDFSYVILPAMVLKDLQMKPRVKYWLIGVLALALFPAAASIVKIALTNYDPIDLTWDLVDVELWNILEAGFGIIIASLPAIRPAFVQASDSWSRYRTSRKAHSSISDQTPDRSAGFELYPATSHRSEIRASSMSTYSKNAESTDGVRQNEDARVYVRSKVVIEHTDRCAEQGLRFDGFNSGNV